MGKASLSLRLTFLLSLSLTASSFPFFHKPSSPSTSTPKATPSDLLSILGPKSQSSKIKPLVAHDLNSCLKFLVPFTPKSPKLRSRKCLTTKKDLGLAKIGASDQRVVDELIWWPPEPVLELARLAVDSGGDPAAIQRALDPTMIAVSSFFMGSVCYLREWPCLWLWIWLCLVMWILFYKVFGLFSIGSVSNV